MARLGEPARGPCLRSRGAGCRRGRHGAGATGRLERARRRDGRGLRARDPARCAVYRNRRGRQAEDRWAGRRDVLQAGRRRAEQHGLLPRRRQQAGSVRAQPARSPHRQAHHPFDPRQRVPWLGARRDGRTVSLAVHVRRQHRPARPARPGVARVPGRRVELRRRAGDDRLRRSGGRPARHGAQGRPGLHDRLAGLARRAERRRSDQGRRPVRAETPVHHHAARPCDLCPLRCALSGLPQCLPDPVELWLRHRQGASRAQPRPPRGSVRDALPEGGAAAEVQLSPACPTRGAGRPPDACQGRPWPQARRRGEGISSDPGRDPGRAQERARQPQQEAANADAPGPLPRVGSMAGLRA